jgi:hypothetical protein
MLHRLAPQTVVLVIADARSMASGSMRSTWKKFAVGKQSVKAKGEDD